MEKSNCFLKMQTCFPSCFVTHYTLVTKIYGRFKYDDIINESKEIRGINKFVYMHICFVFFHRMLGLHRCFMLHCTSNGILSMARVLLCFATDITPTTALWKKTKNWWISPLSSVHTTYLKTYDRFQTVMFSKVEECMKRTKENKQLFITVETCFPTTLCYDTSVCDDCMSNMKPHPQALFHWWFKRVHR